MPRSHDKSKATGRDFQPTTTRSTCESADVDETYQIGGEEEVSIHGMERPSTNKMSSARQKEIDENEEKEQGTGAILIFMRSG